MRLIEADRLIEWVQDLSWKGRILTVPDIRFICNALAKDINVLNKDWISVKDKLPEVGKVVLAFGTRSATTGMFQGVTTRNDCWLWKGCTIKHVSHWMPIEPPKEDA